LLARLVEVDAAGRLGHEACQATARFEYAYPIPGARL
jgi:hypothetical protein